MRRVLFLSNMERQRSMLEEALKEAAPEMEARGATIVISEETMWSLSWQERLNGCSLVVLTWMGSGLDTSFLKKTAQYLQKKKIPHVLLLSDKESGDPAYGVSDEERACLKRYLAWGGMENYRYFWRYIGLRFCGEPWDLKEPQELLWHGIFHPRAAKAYTDIGEYKKDFCRADRPTIGVIFYRDEWVWEDLAYQTALVEEIERQGMNALAVFCQYMKNEEGAPGLGETIAAYFQGPERAEVDVLLNTFKFSMTSMKAVELSQLQQLGVPLFEAYTLYQSKDDWEKSIEGLTPMEMAVSIAMPEFDGALHGVPVASRELLENGQASYQPLSERINSMVRKAAKWAKLRRKANQEKKIGIIFHNYPATNANIGSAAGLDSPESIRLLLAQMQQEGYVVDRIPENSRVFMDELISHATNDRRYMTEKQVAEADGKLADKDYGRFFASMEAETKEQLRRDWGEAPGDVFHYDDMLLIPGMENGNIFITVQPPRGFGEDPGKIYHSPDCAPTHHYLGYYYWLRNVWKADAVVHVGTHGSLEWLPGKGAGLARTCYPELAIDDTPNIYPYWITVVGEGVQAKRRGGACLISYLTPPMSHAGTYEELEDLEKLLDEYCHFRQNQPEQLAVVEDQIRAKAAEANLASDAPEIEGEPFADYVGRLHIYVTDIKNMQIRTGLHTLGRAPAGDELVEYLMALTKVDNGEIPSLFQTVAGLYSYDYYQMLDESAKMLPDGSKTMGALADDVREQCRQMMNSLGETGFAQERVEEAVGSLTWLAALSAEGRGRLLQALRYVCAAIVPSLTQTTQEISNLLLALDGGYVEPGPGGAPTSGQADVLPTGRNFYSIDPRTLPTPTAWEIGCIMGDDVIARYIEEEGRYPESVGIVLWATSNMRSHGQCIAQFLYLLGVRPVWQKGSLRVVDLEIIPLQELKRLRIDATGRISGLFRDSMPMASAWLDQAVAMVAALEESDEDNFIRKHVAADAQEMEQEGVDKETAWKEASWRIFGDPPGTYGAGVSAVLEAKNWETIDDLSDVYVRWGGHAYSGGEKGSYRPDLFRRRMGSLDITIQNQDNREISILNSDDYNAYHGGMIAAVRSIKGEAPRSYCGDSSDRKKVRMRSVQEELRRMFRGEAINPKFIEGMKKHGYKGAADLANYVAHSYQWDATSDIMEDWMYEKYAEKYALDEAMQAWMKDVNPWALQRIAETLLEAAQRGMWQVDDQMKQELESLLLDLEGDLEERGDAD